MLEIVGRGGRYLSHFSLPKTSSYILLAFFAPYISNRIHDAHPQIAKNSGIGRISASPTAATEWRQADERSPDNAASSMSMKARVLAGIKRRPGNTAHAVCDGRCHAGSTRRSPPWRTRGKAK